MIKKLGKKGKAWKKARAKLKKEFQDKGITRCELCSQDFALSFHHRHKRKENDPHTFENVILVCGSCHHKLEFDKELTSKWFKELRGGGNR